MTILLYILFGLACLVLILVVMIQDEQGEGLGGIFGGGSTTPFGSRSGNVLTRFTGIVAAVFFMVCLILGLVNRSPERGEIRKPSDAQVTRQKFFEAPPSPSPTPSVAPTASPSPSSSPVSP